MKYKAVHRATDIVKTRWRVEFQLELGDEFVGAKRLVAIGALFALKPDCSNAAKLVTHLRQESADTLLRSARKSWCFVPDRWSTTRGSRRWAFGHRVPEDLAKTLDYAVHYYILGTEFFV